jgi:membrane protease YdiL (CAAX protease family)
MGFIMPELRAVVVALLVSIPMWVFLPIFASLMGIPVTVNPNWLVVVIGVVLVNGIAEEVIHRAFVFGRLCANCRLAPRPPFRRRSLLLSTSI